MRRDKGRSIPRFPFAAFGVLVISFLMSGFPVAAQNASGTLGGGLDCNGYSPISKNVKPFMVCADPRGLNGKSFYDNGWYIGHDEPSIQFFSDQPNSGNNMIWEVTLPKQDPTPNQSGTSVATFELTPAVWISLALCDPQSYPQNACTPDSDSNTGIGLPTDAGAAALELQFYPPNWGPISCSGPGSFGGVLAHSTQWCAAMGVFSLECTYFYATCNSNCTEPENFAILQDDGIPLGPVAPGEQNEASFTTNSHTLFMNPGDTLLILITDTPEGLLTYILDETTGKEGFMIASAHNGFSNTNISTCQTTPFNFHSEYDTAKPENVMPWTALEFNVNFAVETGHFELGANGDNDADDQPCFPGPTIAGCVAYYGVLPGDLDFDGPPYLPDWPDGSPNHPSPILIGSLNGRGVGPMSFDSSGGYSEPYPSLLFETDITLSLFDLGVCSPTDIAACKVPPLNAAFYPFYNQLGEGSKCRFIFGNDIPGKTTNDFGQDAQYGGLSLINPPLLQSLPMPNPCTP